MPEPLGNFDPDVKMPAAVLAAAKRSDDLFNTYRDQPEEGEEQPPAEPVTAEGNSDQQTPLTAEPPGQPPQTIVSDEPTEPTRDWERDYKSMHGRFMKAQETIRQQGEAIEGLQRVLAAMQTAPAPADENAASNLLGDVELTAEETSEFGEDFMRVVEKKAKQAMAPVVQRYEQEIASLKQRLSGVAGVMQADAQTRVKQQLTELVPNWQQLNYDEQFLAWLGLPDPYSGAIRGEMLKNAYAQGDALRVANFFKGFLAEEAAVAPARAEPHVGSETVPKVPLENLAAPGRAKTAASQTVPAEKPVVTRAQIATFYADVAANKYRGTEGQKEKARIEALIFDAQREGRIR